MKAILELIRIILLVGILGTFAWMVLGSIYVGSDIIESYAWLGAVAILVLLFVLYRNKLQFSGWFKSKHNKKLPRSISATLITISVFMIILPFVLDALFS